MDRSPAPVHRSPLHAKALWLRLALVALCLVPVGSAALAAWREWRPLAQTVPRVGGAQGEGDEETAQVEAQGADASDELDRSSPRATVRGFLEATRERDFELATRFLDFTLQGRELRREPLTSAQRAEYAEKLRVVLDRHVRLDLAAFSDDPQGDLTDMTAPAQERIGAVPLEQRGEKRGEFEILLSRNGTRTDPVWLFSTSTVRQIPELYSSRGYGFIEELLPDYFFELRFLTLELWQWVGLMALAVVAVVLGLLTSVGITLSLRVVLRAKHGLVRRTVIEVLAGPLRIALSVAWFYAGMKLLSLPVAAEEFFGTTCELALVLASAWFFLRAVDGTERVLLQRLEPVSLEAARTLLPTGRRAAKLLVILIAGVSLVNTLGFSVSGLLTTLGIGGLAVALAAQKFFENLIGGVSVIVDQPVRIGEFCKIGDHLGTVEDIGLRSTRIRTLGRTLLNIPNAEVASVRIDNFARRDRIWMHLHLRLRLDTSADQLRHVLVELRKLVYAHPRITDDPGRVRLVELGADALTVEVFAYVDTRDFNEFLAVQEDVLLAMLEVVRAAGTALAYPTQTLLLGRDGGVDAERTRQVEDEVRRAMAADRLPLPDFPRARIEELRGTREWPPVGSATRAAR